MNARYIHKPGARFIHEGTGEHFTYYFDTGIRPGPSHAFHVKRDEFDKMLLDRARATSGAEVREEHTVRKSSSERTASPCALSAADGEYSVKAPMFVDATGRDAFFNFFEQAPHQGRRRDHHTTNVSLNCMYSDVPREQGLEEGRATSSSACSRAAGIG